MKNSSFAMISLLAGVVAFASLIGYIDPGACVNPQVEGWSDCKFAAGQKLYMFWGALAVAISSYTVYRVQLHQSRKQNRD